MKKKILLFYSVLIFFNIMDIFLDTVWEVYTNAYMVAYLKTGETNVNFFGKDYNYSEITDIIRLCTITMNLLSILIILYFLITYVRYETKKETRREVIKEKN